MPPVQSIRATYEGVSSECGNKQWCHTQLIFLLSKDPKALPLAKTARFLFKDKNHPSHQESGFR